MNNVSDQSHQLAVEFGYKQCEKGNNIQMAMHNYLLLTVEPEKTSSAKKEDIRNWIIDVIEKEGEIHILEEEGSVALASIYALPLQEEDYATARLIAAAPAMYNFIKEMAFRYAKSEWIADEANKIINSINYKR